MDEQRVLHCVQIEFECLPLRSVTRLDVPLDASPELASRMLRLRQAIEKHGAHNSYYLHSASCLFHLTNDPSIGTLQFSFEGVVLTGADDTQAVAVDLESSLVGETCDWLQQSVVEWWKLTVSEAVRVEFQRFIAAGDLRRTQERIASLERDLDAGGGFVGMYL